MKTRISFTRNLLFLTIISLGIFFIPFGKTVKGFALDNTAQRLAATTVEVKATPKNVLTDTKDVTNIISRNQLTIKDVLTFSFMIACFCGLVLFLVAVPVIGFFTFNTWSGVSEDSITVQ